MIVHKKNIDVHQFKKVFTKKFTNFCSKLPILISFILQPSGVILYKHFDENDPENKERLFYFEYDYEMDVRKNIYLIKKKLLPYLPLMIQKVREEVRAPAEEINQKISEGTLGLVDVTGEGFWKETERTWRIEKALIERDELFVRNLYDNYLYRFKMKMPITSFLSKLQEGILTPIAAWELFEEKSEQKPLDPTDE